MFCHTKGTGMVRKFLIALVRANFSYICGDLLGAMLLKILLKMFANKKEFSPQTRVMISA